MSRIEALNTSFEMNVTTREEVDNMFGKFIQNNDKENNLVIYNLDGNVFTHLFDFEIPILSFSGSTYLFSYTEDGVLAFIIYED